jgi:WhiB family redox-sensing transcriptional regulator
MGKTYPVVGGGNRMDLSKWPTKFKSQVRWPNVDGATPLQLELIMEMANWIDKKNCTPEDAAVFFSEADTKLAKEICEDCPVKRECGEFALYYPEPHGVWGGMDEKERKQIRKRLKLGSYDEVRRRLERTRDPDGRFRSG